MGAADMLKILEAGGTLAIAGIAIFAWYWERLENRKMTRQLIDLSMAQVETQTENKMLLQGVKELLSQFLSKV